MLSECQLKKCYIVAALTDFIIGYITGEIFHYWASQLLGRSMRLEV